MLHAACCCILAVIQTPDVFASLTNELLVECHCAQLCNCCYSMDSLTGTYYQCHEAQ